MLNRAEELCVPVLLADWTRWRTIEIIEGYFGRSRFQQPQKIERFTALLDEHFDYAALYKALGAEVSELEAGNTKRKPGESRPASSFFVSSARAVRLRGLKPGQAGFRCHGQLSLAASHWVIAGVSRPFISSSNSSNSSRTAPGVQPIQAPRPEC